MKLYDSWDLRSDEDRTTQKVWSTYLGTYTEDKHSKRVTCREALYSAGIHPTRTCTLFTHSHLIFN
jgi:hypothetical protein